MHSATFDTEHEIKSRINRLCRPTIRPLRLTPPVRPNFVEAGTPLSRQQKRPRSDQFGLGETAPTTACAAAHFLARMSFTLH